MKRVVAILGACLAISCQEATHSAYTVEGWLNIHDPSTAGPTVLARRAFRASVSNKVWVITVRLIGNSDFDEFIYSGDGETVSEYIQFASKPGNVRPNDGVMVIQPGQVPQVRNSTFAEVIWFACASQTYLSSRRTNLLAPMWHTPEASEVRAEWSLRRATPFLPERATFRATNDFVQAEFTTLSSTNVGGFSLPLSFSFERFVPVRDTPASSRCITRITATVTNYVFGASPDLLRARTATRNTWVQDHRPVLGAASGFLTDSRDYMIVSNARPPAVAGPNFPVAAGKSETLLQMVTNLPDVVKSEIQGGIGIALVSDPARQLPRVIYVRPGSPAEIGGIKPDDIVTHVDGKSLTGLPLSQIYDDIRGVRWTPVELTVQRNGETNIVRVRRGAPQPVK